MIDARDLIGHWKLIAYELDKGADGKTFPLGADALGRITYGEDGSMTVFLMASDRPATPGSTATPEAKAAAYDSFIAYCGTFEVVGETVIHHVVMSSVAAWSGTDQARDLLLDGDKLVLELTTAAAGAPRTYRLTWRR